MIELEIEDNRFALPILALESAIRRLAIVS